LITSSDNLKLVISQLQPGVKATLKVIRDGLTKIIEITPVARPDDLATTGNDRNSNPEVSSRMQADMLDGVTVQDVLPENRQELAVPEAVQGALVSEVNENSNSAEAGLKRGDIIMEVNRHSVANADDAVRLCKDTKDPQILVKIWRRMGNHAGTHYVSVDNAKRQ
jgi:serine protease Do